MLIYSYNVLCMNYMEILSSVLNKICISGLQSCFWLKKSTNGSVDSMDFHWVAIGPSPRQNHLGGRGEKLINNF